MRILIVTKEVWRDDQNGGNTLTWMFSGFPEDTEFAQVFCSEGVPDNRVCNYYFKISTRDVVKAMINNSQAGKSFTWGYDSNEKNNICVDTQNGISKGLNRITNSEILRDIVWKCGQYRSESLKKFILDFAPDIIYAPGYGVNYMNYLIQWIHSFCKCKIVSLISDDYYSLYKKRVNPLFWVRLLSMRRNIRKSVNTYSLIYTMTEAQRIQLERDFNVPVKIIRKGYIFDNQMILGKVDGEIIRIIHVGNVYFNRWKTLVSLAEAIKKINSEGKKKYQLDIVTSYELKNKIERKLLEKGVVIHKKISYEELKKLYFNSNVAVHVESFDFVNRLKLRLSFSTKIIEYLASGNAVMLICDERQSTYKYLKESDSAILIANKKHIEGELKELYNNKYLIGEKRHKAFEFGKINHSIEKVSTMIIGDFNKLVDSINT